MRKHTIKALFFLIIVKPIVSIVLGLNIRRKTLLPKSGPAIIAANHNSHLDTLVLLSLFPLTILHKVRPIAASDYFTATPFRRFISRYCIDIYPLDRNSDVAKDDLMSIMDSAIKNQEIVLLFPEGTRGEPEQLQKFKKGIAHIACRTPELPVIPIYMHGLGKSLPRDDFLLVPFFCDILIGEPIRSITNSEHFMSFYTEIMSKLSNEIQFPTWYS